MTALLSPKVSGLHHNDVFMRDNHCFIVKSVCLEWISSPHSCIKTATAKTKYLSASLLITEMMARKLHLLRKLLLSN